MNLREQFKKEMDYDCYAYRQDYAGAHQYQDGFNDEYVEQLEDKILQANNEPSHDESNKAYDLQREANKESASDEKKHDNIADVTSRPPNTKFKDNFVRPKDWNVLQIAYASLLFQGTIVLFIKTILYILGYGQ